MDRVLRCLLWAVLSRNHSQSYESWRLDVSGVWMPAADHVKGVAQREDSYLLFDPTYIRPLLTICSRALIAFWGARPQRIRAKAFSWCSSWRLKASPPAKESARVRKSGMVHPLTPIHLCCSHVHDS